MPNKKLKCKWCKKYYPREEIQKRPAGRFCKVSTERNCQLEFALDQTNQKKAKARIRKYESREIKKKKEEVRPISHDHTLTQTAFNKMRVLEEKLWFKERGLKPECISCGGKDMDWCCGHFKTRGSQGNLRYDRKNTYLQCNRYCNKALSGNIEGNKNARGYKQGLIDRFGEAEAKEIIEYCETSTQVKKWTKEELKGLRKEFSERARKLQKQLT